MNVVVPFIHVTVQGPHHRISRIDKVLMPPFVIFQECYPIRNFNANVPYDYSALLNVFGA
jgi:hypothetical protein